MKSKFLLSFFLIISIAAKCQLYNYVQCPTFENQTGYDNSCFTSNDQAGIWCSDGAINDQIRWNKGQSNYIYVDCTLPEFGYTDGTIKVLGYQTLASGNRCAGLIRTCLNDNGTPVSSKGKFSLKLSPNLNSNEDYVLRFKVVRWDGNEVSGDRSPDVSVYLSDEHGETDHKIASYECHHNGGVNNDEWFTYQINFESPNDPNLDWLTFTFENDCIDIITLLNRPYKTGYLIDDVEIYEKCNFNDIYYECSKVGGAGADLAVISGGIHSQYNPWKLDVGEEVIGIAIQIFGGPGFTQLVRTILYGCHNGDFTNLYWDGKNQSGAEVSAGRYRAEVVVINSCDDAGYTFFIVKLNSYTAQTVVPAPVSSLCNLCPIPTPRYEDCCVGTLNLNTLNFQCPPPYIYEYVASDVINFGPDITLGNNVQVYLNAPQIFLIEPINDASSSTLETDEMNSPCRMASYQNWNPDTLLCPMNDTLRLEVGVPDSNLNVIWILPDSSIILGPSLEYVFEGYGIYDFIIGMVDSSAQDTIFSSKSFYVPDCSNARLANSDKLKETESRDVTIYPLPVNEELNIISEEEMEIIQLFNSVGILMVEITKVESDSSNLQVIDTRNFASGIYFIRIKTKTGLHQKTVSITH